MRKKGPSCVRSVSIPDPDAANRTAYASVESDFFPFVFFSAIQFESYVGLSFVSRTLFCEMRVKISSGTKPEIRNTKYAPWLVTLKSSVHIQALHLTKLAERPA